MCSVQWLRRGAFAPQAPFHSPMRSKTIDPTLSSVHDALQILTVDDLKAILQLLSTGSKSTRKADLIEAIESELAGERLKSLWDRLDETQQAAVAEAIYSPEGRHDAAQFHAKYDASPAFRCKQGYRDLPTLLALLFYPDGQYRGSYAVPQDLIPRLQAFVARPAALSIDALEELPECYERIDQMREWQQGDPGRTVISPRGIYVMPTQKPTVKTSVCRIPIERRNTEQDALSEVLIVLRLADQGKLAVSDKTALPGAATLRELGAVLSQGDFYPPEEKTERWEQAIGPIKAYAWALLLQAAGFAELRGKKLALTKLGQDALAKPAADGLRMVSQRWLKSRLFDEFNRVDAIKGQTGKGKRDMTAPVGRRAVVLSALLQCPPGSWVELAKFSRYMQATGLDFQITRNPWHLYISEPQYGSLGYSGSHDWKILQQRYLTCLLFEYAATLGWIDLAYIDPREMSRDYRDLWGTDELTFLSRYDGLLYFRINPLGAYCLGLAESYLPNRPETRARLRVMPSMHVSVVSGMVSTEEALFLDTWAEQTTDSLWRLDRAKILEAIERGQHIDALRDFLAERDEQGLPETVHGFLTQIARHSTALKNTGAALLIECADEALAERIASDAQTKALCQRVGPRHLAVRPNMEDRFRRATRALGYGLPRT